MGWWSEDIFGGDAPLDEICKIEDILGIDDIYPLSLLSKSKKKLIAQAIDKKNDLLIEHISKEDSMSHVLAAVIVSVGAKLDHRIKKAALAELEAEDPVSDGWSNPEKRENVIEEFCGIIEAYDGVPTTLTHHSLVDKMIKFLNGEE